MQISEINKIIVEAENKATSAVLLSRLEGKLEEAGKMEIPEDQLQDGYEVVKKIKSGIEKV